MLWPFPIVDVAAECCRRHRRCRYKTDVLIDLVQSHIILRSVPHGSQIRLESCFVLVSGLKQVAELSHAHRSGICAELCLHCLDLIRNIQHPFQEKQALSFDVHFLAGMHRPESIFKVIMIRSAELVYIAVSAVMVGDHQTIVGNDASCTAEFQ